MEPGESWEEYVAKLTPTERRYLVMSRDLSELIDILPSTSFVEALEEDPALANDVDRLQAAIDGTAENPGSVRASRPGSAYGEAVPMDGWRADQCRIRESMGLS